MLTQTRPILVGQAYSNFGPEIKIDMVKKNHPRVIALGNSHVGQFRSVFFKDSSVFFNTSGAAGTLGDYVNFIKQISTNPPKILIADMEPSMFNSRNKDNAMMRPNLYLVHSTFFDPFFESFFRSGGWWKVYADYAADKFTLADVFMPPTKTVLELGLRAHTASAGATNDGSDYWGEIIHSPENQRKILPAIHKVASTISTNTKFNQYDTQISGEAIIKLRAFLDLCTSNGITVIGFIPPFAHEIYTALREHYGQTESFKKLGPTLAAVYAEYGYDFYDFSDITTFESSDAEMVEMQHGGEKMYLRLFLKMAEGNAALSTLVDIPYLKQRLANATSTYYVFGIDGD